MQATTGSPQFRISPFRIGGYTVATLYALTIIIPFYYVLISSFKSNAEIFNAPLGLPSTLNFENYVLAQERVNILVTMHTSIVVTVATLILTMLIGFPAAYAISRIPTAIAPITEAFFGLGFLIPTFALILPVFLIAAGTGLLYNPLYLIIFYTAVRTPLTVILLASHMREIPIELEEAAVIDGATRLDLIRHIFLPLTRSGLATVTVLNFIFAWNEYLFALILLSGDIRTLQLVIPLLRSERLVDYGLVAAGIVISLVPIYVIFIAFQERVIAGMLSGSVKA